jgi:hypothetical protein
MSNRNTGLELFRVLALCNAYQWHLSCPYHMYDFPDGNFYRRYYLGLFVCTCYTMSGRLQIGTLFSIRKPFRARGVVVFCFAVTFYSRGCSFLFRLVGLPDGRNDIRAHWPITQQLSWFFTAHTIMTFMTPLLHGGMLSMNKRTYAMLNIFMIGLIIWTGPRGVFMKENGYNWMSAVAMYVFAGFFAVHGWAFPGWLTWITWGVIFRCEWYMSGHDLMAEVPPKIAWMFVTFRLRAPIRPRGPIDLPGGYVRYTCPLTFLWGAVSLYAFRLLSFFPGMSKILSFIGGKVFLMHLFDVLPMMNLAMAKWTQRIGPGNAPRIRFIHLILRTLQIANLGFILDIFRERLFGRLFQEIQQIMRDIAEKLKKYEQAKPKGASSDPKLFPIE